MVSSLYRKIFHFSLDKGYFIMYIMVEDTMKHLKQANEAEYLTVEEAARELGIKTTAIRNYLWEEKLTTYKFKTLTLVSKQEVESWKERQK